MEEDVLLNEWETLFGLRSGGPPPPLLDTGGQIAARAAEEDKPIREWAKKKSSLKEHKTHLTNVWKLDAPCRKSNCRTVQAKAFLSSGINSVCHHEISCVISIALSA